MKVLLLLTLISCSKTYDVEFNNNIGLIKDLEFEIKSPRILEWPVGRKKEKTVSKGISFELTIPKLTQRSVNTLQAKFGINSWIYKIEKLQRGKKKILGYIAYNFSTLSASTERFSINVYYHAAAVSRHFRAFHCPAFKHRSVITSLKSEEVKLRKPPLFSTKKDRLVQKVERLSFTTTSYSAGSSLQGRILVSLAFYNLEDKTRYGDFIYAENMLEIQESTVTIPSCLGIQEELNPLPESRLPGFKDLRIKK